MKRSVLILSLAAFVLSSNAQVLKSNLLNGPQRAQGKIFKILSILRRKAYVSCRKYAGISQSAWVIP